MLGATSSRLAMVGYQISHLCAVCNVPATRSKPCTPPTRLRRRSTSHDGQVVYARRLWRSVQSCVRPIACFLGEAAATSFDPPSEQLAFTWVMSAPTNPPTTSVACIQTLHPRPRGRGTW
jgi:hypothetical protein